MIKIQLNPLRNGRDIGCRVFRDSAVLHGILQYCRFIDLNQDLILSCKISAQSVECSEILQRCMKYYSAARSPVLTAGNTALEQIGHNVGEKCTVPNQFFSKVFNLKNHKNYCCFSCFEKLVWYCTCCQNKKRLGGLNSACPFGWSL